MDQKVEINERELKRLKAIERLARNVANQYVNGDGLSEMCHIARQLAGMFGMPTTKTFIESQLPARDSANR